MARWRGRGSALVVLALTCCACSSNSGPPPSATATSTAGGSVVTAAPVEIAQTSMGAVGYRLVGSGPPLLLIMGFGGTLDSWTPDFETALARSHTVITFDNAGIGRSAALAAPQTVTAMAEQSAALIVSLHLARADVLGWSLGGMVAQALTIEHPELVARLILAATLPGNGKATAPSAAVVQQLTDSVKKPVLILPLLFPAAQSAAASDYLTGIYAWPKVESVPAAASAAEGTALRSWSTGGETVGHRLSSITAPTLIADGSDDALIPPANLTALKAAIPHSQTVVFPGAGHAFLFQDQSSFLTRVEAFLASSHQ